MYTFLSPILPTVEEAEITIKIYRQKGQEAANNQELGDHIPEGDDNEDNEEESEERYVNLEEPRIEATQDEDQNTVRFNMDHLTEEEKERRKRE